MMDTTLGSKNLTKNLLRELASPFLFFHTQTCSSFTRPLPYMELYTYQDTFMCLHHPIRCLYQPCEIEKAGILPLLQWRSEKSCDLHESMVANKKNGITPVAFIDFLMNSVPRPLCKRACRGCTGPGLCWRWEDRLCFRGVFSSTGGRQKTKSEWIK